MSENDKSDDQSLLPARWADLVEKVFDRLSGNGAVLTYSFEDLEVNIPKIASPKGYDLSSAKCIINGDIVMKFHAESIEDKK